MATACRAGRHAGVSRAKTFQHALSPRARVRLSQTKPTAPESPRIKQEKDQIKSHKISKAAPYGSRTHDLRITSATLYH